MVTLSGDSINFRRSDNTDENGEFRFRALSGGRYELKVRLWHDPSSKSRLKKEINVTAGQDYSGLNLEIDPGRKINFSGRVVDGEGQPVSKAEVKLYYNPGDKKRFQSRYHRKTKTDDGGNFILSDYLEQKGAVKFTAAKKGHAQVESLEIPLTVSRDRIDGILLELNSGGSIEVEVEDGEGKGVVSSVVCLDDNWLSRGKSVISIRSRKKLTDSLGRCRFDQLPFAGYTIKVSKSDFSPVTEEVRLSEEDPDSRLRVTLESGRDIRITVKNERGEAIEGAKVSVGEKGTPGFITTSSRSKSMTDSGGEVIIRDQSAETVVIEVKADGYVNSGRESVASGRDQIAVILKDAGSIRGRFLNAEKKPVSKVRLIPRRDRKGGDGFSFDIFSHRRTDELGDGCFRLKNMAPGVYRITVKSPGLADLKIEGVEVGADEETDLGEIRFKPEGVISGRITDAGNNILPGRAWARVEASGWSGLAFYGKIDGDGTYSIKGLPAGDYTVIIGAKGYKSGRIPYIFLSSGEKKEVPPIILEKLTPEEELERKQQRNILPSLGVRIKEMDEESVDFKSIRIDEVISGSAAEKSGIRSGDAILKINGNSFSEDPIGFLQGMMSKPGTELKITVKRGESGEEEEVDLTVDDWSYEEMLKKWMGE